MALHVWGINNIDPFVLDGSAGYQVKPVVADSGGTELAVAWVSDASISVTFYDEQGLVSAARPTTILNDGVYGGSNLASSVSGLALSAGGSGIGYGALWEESVAGQPTLLRMRYVGLASTVGDEVAISTSANGLNQHDAAVSASTKDDANGRPNVDGFDVVWVESAAGAHSLGNVYLQRFAVPLDRRKDPLSGPQKAGLDGRPPADAQNTDADAQTLLGVGRDPTVAGLLGAANETVVAWADQFNQVHLRVFNDNGSVNTTEVVNGPVNAVGAPPANLGTTTANGEIHAIALAGGGFVIAWVGESAPGNLALQARVYAPGAAGGTFSTGAVITLSDLPDDLTDFAITALDANGGFVVSWSGLDAGAPSIFSRSFSAAGAAQEAAPLVTHVATDGGVALGSLIGDRVITVFHDTSVPGDPGNIGAQILDTRTLPDGSPIVVGGLGLSLVGDPAGGGGGGGAAGAPDVLVGTVGADTIDGRLSNDILNGALGADTILAGGGDDAIDGGGDADTVVFTGRFSIDGDSANDDYVVTALGGGLFTVSDLRLSAPDGVDTIRGVELFSFQGSGLVFTAAELAGQAPDVTPTAWGLSDIDADFAPNFLVSPDVDGFIVNAASNGQTGAQSRPVVADSVGEFFAVVWESDPSNSGDTFIRAQFLDVLGAPDTNTPLPLPVTLSDGFGIEFNPNIASGGANSGWGFTFEERDTAADTTRTIRTNFMGPVSLTGVEQSVLVEGPNVDQHDAAVYGSFLDRTLEDPVGGSAIGPLSMSDGYNVAWISTDLNAGVATNVAGDARYGRVMLQRFEVDLDALGNSGAPKAGGLDGISGLNNVFNTGDSAVWVGDEDANGVGGAIGRNVQTAALHTWESAVIWIEQDGAGGERIAGRAYDDLGNIISFAPFQNLSAGFPVAAGTNAYIVSAGAVNFAVAWITADASSPSGYSVMGTMLSSAGNGLNGQGFGFAATGAPFKLMQLPAGFVPTAADFHLTGISGEDSSDVIVSWNLNGDIQAQHIRTTLDPTTGVALAMSPDGDAVTVNATTTGVQDQSSIAGMLSDRFITVYRDTSGVTNDAAGDIVARIMDTRALGQVLEGDLVVPAGIQARADVIVGTVGDDLIIGDRLDNDGRTDHLYGGMGDDTLRGGPDQSAGARVEVLDGGEGTDTAVYTGRMTDYAISINGDGSVVVSDLRPLQSPTGVALQHDGTDYLYSVERLVFLGDGGQAVTLQFAPTPNPLDPSYNGTLTPWSLTDASPYKALLISTDPVNPAQAQPGVQSQISLAGLQNDAAMSWVSDGAHIFTIRYDTFGAPDALVSSNPIELTDDATLAGATASPFTTMAGGLGWITTWESTPNGGNTAIHMAYGSIGTNTVLNGGAGIPGGGIATQQVGVAGDNPNTGEDVVVGSSVAGKTADAATAQGYEIVDVNNDTLEFGFHVAFVLKDSAANAFGQIEIARYDIPVYDLDPAAGPVNGTLLLDANGNFVASADFGTGAETQPISIGADGLRGTADDTQALAIGLGRDPSLAGLHDSELVVVYVDSSEHVQLRIFAPTIDEAADRENRAGVGGEDLFARGQTTFNLITPIFPTDLGVTIAGQKAVVRAQQNGSFGVYWAEAGAVSGTVDIKGISYIAGGANNWSPTGVQTLKTGLPSDVEFQVANTGVDVFGLEDGISLLWSTGGAVMQQRYDLSGAPVGDTARVDDPADGNSGVSASQTEDGRVLVGYQDAAGDVFAQYLDTRQAGTEIIGPRLGAPRDVLVGTNGDDNMTGGQLEDEMHGGFGDDLMSGGTGADILIGDAGKDTLIGALGQDQLLGGDGADMLWTGLSGPADPKVSRDLQTGLTAAGVNAALIASNAGADIVSGGAGVDTLSYQGELGRFNIDLGSGLILADRNNSNVFTLEDVIGEIVPDGAGGTVFQFALDIENAIGGLGDDIITGSGGDNVLAGGGGNNVFNGGGGSDTIIIDGVFATYTFTRTTTVAAGDTLRIADAEDTQTIRNAEFVQFSDRLVSVAAINAILANGASASGAALNVADVNNAPVAAPDSASVLQAHTALIDVLANDTDADGGQTLKVTAVDGAAIGANQVSVANGIVSLTANGKLAFTANALFTGPTSFTYTISDGFGGTSTATVNVNVTPFGAQAIVNNGASLVSIAGLAAEHQTLTAQVGVDPDGPGTLPTFQWLQDGAVIVGATQETFVLTAAHVGHVIAVRAFYTDGEGFAETVTSAPTPSIAAVNDGAASIAITGVAAEHQTLNAVLGADPDGAGGAASFQWLRNNVLLPNATASSYVLTATDVGAQISVRVAYTDGQGFNELATSAATAVVTPVNDGAATVTITGTATVGQTLTANVGADPDGAGTAPAYQWLRNGSVIVGATQATFTLTASEAGTSVSVRVSYTDGQGFAEAPVSNTLAVTGAGGGVITGTGAANNIVGSAGPDTINALGGADTVNGGGGNDTVDAGAGNDLILAAVGDGNDRYTGGAGADTYDLSATGAAATVDLAAGVAASADAGSDLLFTIEHVTGGGGADTLRGDGAANLLIGGGGNDTLDGGTAGADSLRGGLGDDTYTVSHTGMSLTEAAGEGTDTVSAAITFTLGANFENLVLTGTAAINGSGNAANNVITGNAGVNTLSGAAGNDAFIAFVGDGNDSYNGGADIDTLDLSATSAGAIVNLATGVASSANIGADTLAAIENVIGGSGADVITASTVANVIAGGGGADRFVFLTRQGAGVGLTRDIIQDFTLGQDRVDIAQIDSDSRAAAAGIQTWIFDGAKAAGTEAVGHVGYHFETIGTTEYTVIEGNVRTAASTTELNQDFQIALLGHHALTSADLILI